MARKYAACLPNYACVDGYPQLLNLFESQCNLVTADALQADKSKGAGVKVGFFNSPQTAKTLINYKEQGVLPDLELMVNHGVGTNHFPFEKMKELGIRATNTPHVLSDGTADMGFALMLASGRRLKEGMKRLEAEDNKQLFGGRLYGQDVCYSTLGIVGMGSIGYEVAKRAKAFKMKILYHNRSRRPESEEAEVGAVYYADMMEMLPLCDFVMVVCPLTAETKNLFSKPQFDAMKNTAHFINIARGGIVDTDALYQALKSGDIAAAGLDVTEPEPLPHDHPLYKLDNAVVVPHWGSATIQTRSKMIQLMIDNGRALYDGKPLLSEVKF